MSAESFISFCIQDLEKGVYDENAVIRVSVKDYTGQNNSFTVKIVFPYHNSRFKYLMNSIRPNEPVLFVIGQMEVMQDDLYVQQAVGKLTHTKLNKFQNYHYFTEYDILVRSRPFLKEQKLLLMISDETGEFTHEKVEKDHLIRYLKKIEVVNID